MAPPRPPSPTDDLEALIREARARQRKRWVGAAALVAVLAGAAVGISSVVGSTGPRNTTAGRQRFAPVSTSRCGIRVEGVRIFQGGLLVYREPGHYIHPNGGPPAEVQCSGPTVWVVWAFGVGMMHEDYVGVRSPDRGRTWRVAFAQNPAVRAKYGIGAEVGPWALVGRRAAYFVGSCPACSDGPTSGTFTLSVTKDGGRTFRTYPVRAVNRFEPLRIRVTGKVVTILGRRIVGRVDKPPFRIYRHETVTVHVA